jgi:hypothetical protein
MASLKSAGRVSKMDDQHIEEIAAKYARDVLVEHYPADNLPALFRGAIREALSSQEENERLAFEHLSKALAGGNASTWDEVFHAAEQSGEALRSLREERDAQRDRADLGEIERDGTMGERDYYMTRAESAEAELQRLRSLLGQAKPIHYAGECLICQDEEPCPALALIAEIDRLLASPAESRSEQTRPLPPDVLADARQDPIHPASGTLLSAKTVKEP